jgi:hypothetical protein
MRTPAAQRKLFGRLALRYPRAIRLSPSFSLSLSQNAIASSQDTLSTGRSSGPWNWLGPCPVTARYWPWVTSVEPR